jgi:dTDP-4-amino-4,6-dideoxygalactose transaminase
MNVPFFDLKRVLEEHNDDLVSAFEGCLDHGRFILGPDVKEFEQVFSEKMNSKHCVGVSSGTDALLAIFMALELEPGSEVIVPSFTFVASASSILRAGLTPVFADLGAGSFAPSIDTIKSVWTDKTKAVLFVHLFGEATDLSELKGVCDDRGAFLIEDCAQSYGSPTGEHSLASAFSFFPAKNLGCLGDGGAITTNDDKFFNSLKVVRSHGSREKYNYELLGGNFRLDTIQASFLRVLIQESDEWISKRRKNANYYSQHLKNVSGLMLPEDSDGHSWNQYTLRTKRRNELKKFLDSNNIGNAVYYPIPLHKSKIFKSNNTLKETEKRCKEVLSIPIYPGLSVYEREYVITKIKDFFYV